MIEDLLAQTGRGLLSARQRRRLHRAAFDAALARAYLVRTDNRVRVDVMTR